MKSIFLAKSDWWQSIGPFPRLLYSIAVCYNMLHHIAGCCRMLQYIAVCCRMLQDVAVYCSMLQCVAVYCSMLQCIAVCCIYCSMLQYVAVRYSMLQYIAVCYRMLHYIAVCCIALLYCRIFSKYPYYGKFLLVANYYWWQIIIGGKLLLVANYWPFPEITIVREAWSWWGRARKNSWRPLVQANTRHVYSDFWWTAFFLNMGFGCTCASL